MNARITQQLNKGWITNKLSVFVVVLLAVLTTALTSTFTQIINTTNAYALAAPTLTSATPSTGYNYGGDTVTIVGANFQDGAKVKFGAVTTDTTFIDANTLTAIVPANEQIGLVSFSIINPDGQSGEIQNAFEMKQAAPTVT
ncbi:MAG: IPT/TIG domain-containing protein, partial [Ignavibacteria bacterium]|nr:IPT/TIG domain-containing protein [Ignavibacteria bacterium]